MVAISLFLGGLGLGFLGLAAGLLVGGPLALDKRWERRRSDSAYTRSNDDALDLHADRALGSLEGTADAIWRPVASVHFLTTGLIGFGATGLALTAAGFAPPTPLWSAVVAGLIVGYLGSAFLRGLPHDGSAPRQ